MLDEGAIRIVEKRPVGAARQVQRHIVDQRLAPRRGERHRRGPELPEGTVRGVADRVEVVDAAEIERLDAPGRGHHLRRETGYPVLAQQIMDRLLDATGEQELLETFVFHSGEM